MSETKQRGADWISGGELKALHRIVGGTSEDDEDAPAPVGHNRPPQGAVHETTGPEIALEEQAEAVERALTASDTAQSEAEGKAVRVGQELRRLREIFVEIGRQRNLKLINLHTAGLSYSEIAEQVGLPVAMVTKRIQRKSQQSGRVEVNAFFEWATQRFNKKRSTLRNYMALAVDGNRKYREAARNQKKRNENRKLLLDFVKGAEAQNMKASLFKKAFMVLQPPPARKETLLWACSMVIGSEDPQEIARWFADAMGKR
jgi:DNA-directed RNA polymerase specialized sigma24 family protein